MKDMKTLTIGNNTYEVIDPVARAAIEGLIDKIYPVGSVYITGTNASPESYLGGTWTLVDKKYKNDRSLRDSFFTANTTNISTVNNIAARWTDESVQIRMTLTNAVTMGDTTLTLGQINLGTLGVVETWTNYFVGYSDGGNGVVMMQATNSGALQSVDVVPKGTATTIAAGQNISMEWSYYVSWNNRADAFCDRFIWSRTA